MPILNNDTLYVGSVGLRVSEVNSLIGEGLDVGSLCTSARINKWAKWKPFRSAAIGFSTASDQMDAMKNVNMGLSITTADISSGHISNPAWTYNKPRGIKNTSTNPTTNDEWYRLLDFAPLGSTTAAPGYCHNAVAPIAVEWPQFLYCDFQIRVTLFADQQVNTGTSSWDPDTCISLFDILMGSGNTENNYADYYIALLITNNSGGQNSNVLLSSGVTLRAFSTYQQPLYVDFCSYEAPESAQAGCIVMPEYTLAPNKTGQNFDVAWVLAPLSSSDTYMTTNFPTMISLNLESGVNFNNLRLDYADTIYGLTGYITTSSPALTSTGVTCQFSIQESGTYILYHLGTLKAYLDVSDCDWHIVSNGSLANRQEVYIELGSSSGSPATPVVATATTAHAFIVTTDVIPDPTQVDLTTAYSQYYNNNVAAMKAYVPASGKRYFKAEITKQEVTKVCSLSSAPGAGNVLPDIYVWIKNDTASGDDILETHGFAWSKYANSASSPSGMSVSLDTGYITF